MTDQLDLKFLSELAKSYPNSAAVTSQIVHLNAILNLPKGTEHFLSDIHGEYEAFAHIRKNASGVIKRKVDALFENEMSEDERREFATLIYYPEQKLEMILEVTADKFEWYRKTLQRLVSLCRFVGSKYTRMWVEESIKNKVGDYFDIIDELLNSRADEPNKENYYQSIYKTIIRVGCADGFITALCTAIKSLVIDHLHIVGDLFDRGPRADLVVDELMQERSVDIQWGNHDILWMGAALGSQACIATVINNSMTYRNLDVIEIGYGISLRPLAMFADEVYRNTDLVRFMPKGSIGGDRIARGDDYLIAAMHKAISVIQMKLEGQIILSHPEYDMNDRLLLGQINVDTKSVRIDGCDYDLADNCFPTVDFENPYALTDKEREVMRYLRSAFMRSEKLHRHLRFLYEYGSMYTIYNRNLLFHGCIPMDKNGDFLPLSAAGNRSGKALMDYCDEVARLAFSSTPESIEGKNARDFLWFLWCGKDSPLCGRKKITTFERLFANDPSLSDEPRNDYYNIWDNPELAKKILAEFNLTGMRCHIINGHIPVAKGDGPVKSGGRLIVIDGGLCKLYYSKTGISGYTLIYNADGMRISAHQPFNGREKAIRENSDIHSQTVIFEEVSDKIRIKDTDKGDRILDEIADLLKLLRAYENALIKEKI